MVALLRENSELFTNLPAQFSVFSANNGVIKIQNVRKLQKSSKFNVYSNILVKTKHGKQLQSYDYCPRFAVSQSWN